MTQDLLGSRVRENQRHAATAGGQHLYVFATPDIDAEEGIPGTVLTQWVRCGKAGCRCATGKPHGPYFYHYFRQDTFADDGAGGLVRTGRRRQTKRYIPRDDAPRVLALCQRYRERRYCLRRALAVCRVGRGWREPARTMEEQDGW